jgi:hypothetical protein
VVGDFVGCVLIPERRAPTPDHSTASFDVNGINAVRKLAPLPKPHQDQTSTG